MKTDSLIHRFFREFTGAFFTLMGEEERKAGTTNLRSGSERAAVSLRRRFLAGLAQ